VVICNDWFSDGDVVIAPWLCGDDHKRIPKLTGKYMFGHFELPGYYMNAMVQMPDHGKYNVKTLVGLIMCLLDTFTNVRPNKHHLYW
jgi:hypothetical protein